MFWGGLCIKRKMQTCHEDSCHLVKALLFRLPLESVTMGGSEKIFILMYVLTALIELGFGNQYICHNPKYYDGKKVADPKGKFVGECVSFYKTCSRDPRSTPSWRRGPQVKGNRNIAKGTGIASFTNGSSYVGSNCNNPLPCGHVAIYDGQNRQGIQVWDQWKTQPVHQRTLYFGRRGANPTSNDGDYFYVIN